MREEDAVNKYIRINPNTQMFEPVWMYRDILTYWLGPDPVVTTPITLPAFGSGGKVVPFKLPHSSIGADGGLGNPLMIDQIVFLDGAGSSQFSVFLTDQGDQHQFMNYPVHVKTFAGSGQLSARLSEPLFLPTRHQLNATLSMIANGTQPTVNMFFVGPLFDTWSSNLQKHTKDRSEMIALIKKWLERRKYVSPYWMTTEGGAVTVPANQTVEVDALVGSEGHLESTHILRAFSTSGQAAAPFEVSILNPQTRQALSNGAIHSYFIGDADNPQPFPCSFVTPAGQIIRFRIKDLSGSTNTVYLTLRGRKWRCPFKDIDEVKKQYGIGIVDGYPKPFRSMQVEMEGVRG